MTHDLQSASYDLPWIERFPIVFEEAIRELEAVLGAEQAAELAGEVGLDEQASARTAQEREELPIVDRKDRRQRDEPGPPTLLGQDLHGVADRSDRRAPRHEGELGVG